MKTTTSAWVKSIADMFDTIGLDKSALFREADLDMALLDDPHAKYATEALSRLWKIAAERSGNPAIGLAMSHIARPASFDIITYTVMSCPNLLAGLERLVRYLRIISDAVTVSLQEDNEGLWFTLDINGGTDPIPIQRADYILATLLTFFRWLTASNLRPIAIEWVYPAPSELSAYHDTFQCPLHFDAAANRMLISHSDLGLTLPTSNPFLIELHDRYAVEFLDRLDCAKISNKIRQLITRKLPDGDPLRGDIAQELCMSERTLQRRLSEEGTSFNQLVDEVREELAQRYLKQSHLSLSQITYLLGFAEKSTFFRVCKRWFDMSPNQYRAKFGKPGDDNVKRI